MRLITARLCVLAGLSTPIEFAPRFPIPGVPDNSDWHVHPAPSYMGATFVAFCQFWKVASEVFLFYRFIDMESTSERPPLAFAHAKFQLLLSMTGRLPRVMDRREDTPGHALIFQYVLFLSLQVLKLRYAGSFSTPSSWISSDPFMARAPTSTKPLQAPQTP